MGKTNFTFVQRLLLVVTMAAFGFMPNANAAAPHDTYDCTHPLNGVESNVQGTSATFTWESQNTPVDDHCWNFYIGNEGFDCDENEEFIAATVCDIHVNGAHNYTSNNPLVTLTSVNDASGVVSIDVTGLQPGTFYEWSLFETCDGNPGNNGLDCSDATFGPFQTWDDPYTVSSTSTIPTCPLVSPGFTPDGSFTVSIGDSPTCAGTYDIAVAGPYAVNPAGYTGVPAGGPYTFNNAGPGNYTVTITETSVCHPSNDPEVIVVTVGDGVDTEDPIFYVLDILGNIIVDNDPNTPEGPNVDWGVYDLPEGSCNYQEEWFAYGHDNCDGLITSPNAVTTSSVTTPNTVFPATQTSVTDDGFGFYRIDVNWSVLQTTITVCMADAAGNNPCLTVSRYLDDWNNPDVTIVGANNTTIPQCDTERTIIVTVYIDASCDQSVDENNIVFNSPGSPNVINFIGDGYVEYAVTVTLDDDGNIWNASYSDGLDNGFADVQITVAQAATDEPAVIIAADDNVTIPYCEDDVLFCYSFQIYDDCQDPPAAADINFNGGGSGLVFSYQNIDNQTNVGFYEYCGTVASGIYILDIAYDGQSVDPVVIINQQQNQAPVVTLPGNLNWTIPVCQPSVTTLFSVQINDDCDDSFAPTVSIENHLGINAPVPVLNWTDGQGYFEYSVTFTPENNGNLLVVSVTDSNGETTIQDAEISITDQPDNWAPIIVYPSQDIFIDLDPCDAPSAIVSFDVTVTDNCDGDMNPNSITLLSNDGTLLNNAVINTPGGDSYILLLGVGTYQILISATDAAGNTREEDFRVFITQDPAPEDNLACIADINITLDDNCEADLSGAIVFTGEWGCLTEDDFTITVIDSDPSNGSIIDGCGTYGYNIALNAAPPTIGFTGDFAPQNWTTQTSSNGASVSFAADGSSVEFNAGSSFFGFNSSALAMIAFPEDGNVTFDWEYDGNDPGFDFFGWVIDNNGTVVSSFSNTSGGNGSADEDVQAGWGIVMGVSSPFDAFINSTATISNWVFQPSGGDANFTQCWGEVTAEDKTNPTISCPADTDQVTYDRDVQFISGALETTDAQMNTANYTCFLDAFNPLDGDHYYDTYTFTVSNTTPDYFTFEMSSAWGDAAAVLYQGAFNPDSPCENVISQSDDWNIVYTGGFGNFWAVPNFGNISFDPTIRVSIPLQAGQTYTLLTTSWADDVTGGYTWAVYTDGNSSINGVAVQQEPFTYDLVCDDLDEILIDGVEYYTTNADGSTVPGSMSSTLSGILDLTGRPTIWDNCGQVRVAVWDELTENGDCGDKIITRHFDVADRYNSDCTGAPMTASCTQEITIRNAESADLSFPPITAYLECDEGFETLANGNPSPVATGFPFVQTAFGVHVLDEVYCNYAANYADSNPIEICESGYKVIRTWSILNWCDPAPVITQVQVIKVGDFTAPEISCHLVDNDWEGVANDIHVYSTGPFDCTAAFPVVTPVVTDNCSSYEIVVDVVIHVEQDVYNQWGQVIGTEVVEQVIATVAPGDFVSGVPVSTLGNHFFRYTVTDDCGNTATADCEFAVVDGVAPIAICDDNLNISIGGQGYARVYAEDVDEGSHDNCSDVSIEVRRAGGVWGPWVDFDCSDVNTLVTIELRVWDASGNSNLCWLEVLIEDKINPYCFAPHNDSRDCDDEELLHIDWDDADQLNEVFGAATAEDNCNATAEQVSVNNNLNDCGWGTVVRTFRATDDWGNFSTNACQQVITIYEVHNYEIKFPKDASAECGVPNPDTIEYNTLGCDLITVNVDDQLFEATSDECYKILRTYDVINWCEWDGESDPIVIGRDEDCDNNPGDEDVWVMVRTEGTGNFVAYVDRDNDENNTNPFIGTSRCTPLPKPNGHWANSGINTELTSIGRWQYTQVIKVYDFVAPTATVDDYDTFCSETADCYGDAEVSFTVTEECDLSVVTVVGYIDLYADGVLDGDATVAGPDGIDDTNASYTISGNYPIGSHIFSVHIEDGCNNITWLEIPFDVVDCKGPTPICINGLTVTLMPQPDDCCAMAIWATDFIASAIEDCTEPIKYSIHREADVEDGTDIPSSDQTGLVLDCNDEPTVMIRIYSWDSAYNPYAVQPDGTVGGPNYDYCQTYVLVQQWVTCVTGPSPLTVAGAIQTEEAEGLEGAEVQLSSGVFLDALTATDGSYEFVDAVNTGNDITITPHLDANPLNGVSTFDLVLISKHILGVQLLDSPYKLISADVNSSGTVTTADMIQLRKLILGVYTDFPNNTSWRFVDADYVFPDPTNPWSEEFPEVININDIQVDEMNENFVSAKIGDVNGSATPNFMSVEDRNVVGLFALTTENVTVKAGNEYSVSFTAADLAKTQGYQFTLTFDQTALSFTDIEYGVATAKNFGMTFLSEGIITTSWNGEAADDAVLFTLIFNANTEAVLSDLIGISSRYTVAEAYNTENGTMDVAINFTNGVVATAGFEVYQNTPNPFNGETLIGYNLPEDADVTITIQDVTGKTLKVVTEAGVKGYNSYTLKSELGATGVLYYTVSTDEFTATKKMILVK